MIEKDEWKDKAKRLADGFFGTLKDLKSSMYKVKKDSETNIKVAREEF